MRKDWRIWVFALVTAALVWLVGLFDPNLATAVTASLTVVVPLLVPSGCEQHGGAGA